MDEFELQIERAYRLDEITRQVGLTLWQIQTLEDVSAQCLVLLTKAQKGMGEEAGTILLQKAQKRTFGGNVTMMVDAGIIRSDILPLLTWIVDERNWLVHRSRHEHESAVNSDAATNALIIRLNTIHQNVMKLINEVFEIVEAYVLKHGVAKEDIENIRF